MNQYKNKTPKCRRSVNDRIINDTLRKQPTFPVVIVNEEEIFAVNQITGLQGQWPALIIKARAVWGQGGSSSAIYLHSFQAQQGKAW